MHNYTPRCSTPALDPHVMPILSWQGMTLGVTTCRASARHGRCMSGFDLTPQLKTAVDTDTLINPVDVLLDLVVLDTQHPRGFEFSGLSLAEFWTALLLTDTPPHALTAIHAHLSTPALDALRQHLRQALSTTPRRYEATLFCAQAHGHQHTPNTPLRPAIATLLKASTGKAGIGRNPWMIEVNASHYAPQRAPGRVFTDQDWLAAPARDQRGMPYLPWQHIRLPHATPQRLHCIELQMSLPCLAPSYYSLHYPARNLFAHVRGALLQTTGRRFLLIDEIQSDWSNDWRQQQSGKPITCTPRGRWQGLDAMHSVPPCPLGKGWLDAALAATVRYARREACDLIAWVPAALQCHVQANLPFSVAREIYDKRLPKILRQLLGDDTPHHLPYEGLHSPFHLHYNGPDDWQLLDALGDPHKLGLMSLPKAHEMLARYSTPAHYRLPALSLHSPEQYLFPDNE